MNRWWLWFSLTLLLIILVITSVVILALKEKKELKLCPKEVRCYNYFLFCTKGCYTTLRQIDCNKKHDTERDRCIK